MILEEKVAQKLIKTKKTLSLAESCSGGLLSHRLTNIPGSSHFLKFSVVVYDNQAKIKLLSVPPLLIKRNGAVSEPVAIAMARGIRKVLNTSFGISVTGIAGPGGGTKEKPVGLIYIGLAQKSPAKSICQKYLFKGTRTQIKAKAVRAALKLLQKSLHA